MIIIIGTAAYLGLAYVNDWTPFPPCYSITTEVIDDKSDLIKIKNIDEFRSVHLTDLRVIFSENEISEGIKVIDNWEGDNSVWAPQTTLEINIGKYKRPGKLSLRSKNPFKDCDLFIDQQILDYSKPKISSFSPNPMYVGTYKKDWVVTLKGENFKENMKVQLNGVDRISTYKDETTIQALLLESDESIPGEYKISIIDQNREQVIGQDGSPLVTSYSLQNPPPAPPPPPPPPPPPKYEFMFEGMGLINILPKSEISFEVTDKSSTIRMCNYKSCNSRQSLSPGDIVKIGTITPQKIDISISPSNIFGPYMEQTTIRINEDNLGLRWIQDMKIFGYKNLEIKNSNLIVSSIGDGFKGKFNNRLYDVKSGRTLMINNIDIDSMGILIIKNSGYAQFMIKGSAESVT